jgi:phosphoserine phosphatase
MSYVLTLIGAAGAREVVETMADDLCRAIKANRPPFWLSPEACDIAFRPADDQALAQAQAAIDAIPADAPIDRLIQPVEGRRKRLLVADMDSTIIEQECLDEVAKAAGIGARIAAITEQAMNGDLEFEDALRDRVALLRGFPEARLQEILDQQITLAPGACELAATMRANGGRAVLVSGGFTFFTQGVAKRAGFDVDYANRFIFENGALAGIAEPILGRDAKRAAMEKEAKALGLGHSEIVAVGDGANDLAMLEAAGLGVAYRAKPVAAAGARVKINHGDLTAVLYLQGYRSAEIVARL